MPHEIATVRGVAVRDLADVQQPWGVSVAISVSRVAPLGIRAVLEPVEGSGRSRGRRRRSGLRHHVAVGARRDRRLEVGLAVAGGGADSSAPSARAGRNRGRATHRPRRAWPPCGRAPRGVLEVEDQAVGGSVSARAAIRSVAPGTKWSVRRGPRHAQASYLAHSSRFRRATMTTSPCWLIARCTNVTMPIEDANATRACRQLRSPSRWYRRGKRVWGTQPSRIQGSQPSFPTSSRRPRADRDAEREEAGSPAACRTRPFAAAWKSTCRDCGFMVRQENHTLSASSPCVRAGAEGLSDRELLEVLSGHDVPPMGSELTAVVPDSINGGPWKTPTTSRSSAAASSGSRTARALNERAPRARLRRPREGGEARHPPAGNNSGVIHSGIYYKPAPTRPNSASRARG